MSRFQVIVGNVGTVYDGANEATADREFYAYVKLAKGRGEGSSRAAGEHVALMADGEISREFCPLRFVAEVTRLRKVIAECKHRLARTELRLAQFQCDTSKLGWLTSSVQLAEGELRHARAQHKLAAQAVEDAE
jgi:hypothetical protein